MDVMDHSKIGFSLKNDYENQRSNQSFVFVFSIFLLFLLVHLSKGT